MTLFFFLGGLESRWNPLKTSTLGIEEILLVNWEERQIWDRRIRGILFFKRWIIKESPPWIIERRTQKLRFKSLYAQLLKKPFLNLMWTTFLRWDIEWDFNRSRHVLTKVFKIIQLKILGLTNELAKLFYSRQAVVDQRVHIWSDNSRFGQELKWVWKIG